MTRKQELRAQLERVKREGGPLDEFARIKLALLDAEADASKAVPLARPEPIRGGGVHAM